MQIELRLVVEEAQYLRMAQGAQAKQMTTEAFIKQVAIDAANRALVEHSLGASDDQTLPSNVAEEATKDDESDQNS